MGLTPGGGGVPTVVRYCKLKGCRPIDVPGAPCSRCGTWQSYPKPAWAALKWTLNKVVEESENVAPRWPG